MKSKSEIRHRLKTIEQTRQITKAMHLISIAKMKRAMARYASNSHYFKRVRSTLKDILTHSEQLDHPYFVHRPGGRSAYVVIGGDKGLAGGYNHNIISEALKHMRGKDDVSVMSIGQVVNEYFSHHNMHVDVEFLHMSQNPTLYNARSVAETLIDLYNQNALDEVWIIYTHMINSAIQEPSAIKLLPVEASDFEDSEVETRYVNKLEFYPTKNDVLENLVPEYLIGVVYTCLVQAYASEQCARMNAMDSATRNADEFIQKLTLEYNRARQSGITQEIAEISAGADALRTQGGH